MENMELVNAEEARKEQFPVGMRVLAVDDNPTCLRKLEELLLRCKYHVTKTMDSKKALEMLRDKSNMFDLVISDVEMPDVDGFKLLELVGLEMDLPVIMLSAHSDYDHVMKGIRHGACDYLVKPVGLKELRNIWQHVVRKNSNSHAKAIGSSRSLLPQSDSHPSSSVSKKRKGFSRDKIDESGDGDGDDDDSDGEEEDGEESEHDDDDSCSRKKPRVVWVVELHQKFVAAVQQLGLDKAVPKKILDLMNVEGLTRENVASHLQKYRLYLKKMDENQHNMATDAYGRRDSSYLQMAQLDGLRDFPSLTATRQLPSSTLLNRSHLTKLNPSLCSPINLQGINSSSFIQQGHYDNTSSNSSNLFGTYQHNLLPRLQNTNPFQRTSSPLETIQFPRNKCPPYMGDFKTTPGSNFLDSQMSFGTSSNSSNSLLLQSNFRQPLHRGSDGNQSCPPSSSSSPNINGHMLSRFPSHNRSSSNNWQWNLKPTRFPSSSLPLNPVFPQDLVTYGGNAGDCTSLVSAENPGGETLQCDTQLLGDFIQNMNTLEEHKGTVLNGSFGNVDYPLPLPIDNSITTLNTQQVYMEPEMKPEKPENAALIDNQQDAFDEIMNEMMKQDDNNGMGSIAARFGFDSFPPPLP